jgi:hypothetical protein
VPIIIQEYWTNVQELREKNIDIDVHIIAGNKQNQRMFKAHTRVLTGRCEYFRVALSNRWAHKDQNGIIIFHKENISPKIFDLIIE